MEKSKDNKKNELKIDPKKIKLKEEPKKKVTIELVPKRMAKTEENKKKKEEKDDDERFFQSTERKRIRMWNPSLVINRANGDSLEDEIADAPITPNRDSEPVVYNAPSYSNQPSYAGSQISYATAGSNSPEPNMSGGMINPAANEAFKLSEWQNKNMDSDMMGTKRNMDDHYALNTEGTRFQEDTGPAHMRRERRPGF